ncbi:unnamed protein product [Brassicogethes aeneus]|uniref:ascorbate ferrireductase (transmembrane) n=1 Tax=Brassicogethes aeneus TaxID=1431903 RepID=A0A9P0AYQ8_BRAAE|nr:unnamed protein product [Brassicogethes aeneus]
MATLNISMKTRFFWIANILFHNLVAVVTVVLLTIIVQHSKLNSYKTWHYILCTLGYGLFMAEAIVIFSKNSSFTQDLNRRVNGYIHGILMGLAVISTTIGISFKIYQKNTSNSEHFTTNHGITGLVSWLLAMVAVFGGLAALFSKPFENYIKPIYIKFLHNFLGISSFSIGCASLALGLEKHAILFHTSPETRVALTWAISIMTAMALLGALKSFYNQFKTVFAR